MLLLLKNVFDFPLAPSRLNHFNCFQTGSLRAQLSTTNWGVESIFFFTVLPLKPHNSLHPPHSTQAHKHAHVRKCIYVWQFTIVLSFLLWPWYSHCQQLISRSHSTAFVVDSLAVLSLCPVFFFLPITWFYLSSLKTTAIKSKRTKVKCKML